MLLPQFPDSVGIGSISRDGYNAALPSYEVGSDFQWLSLRTWNPDARVSEHAGAVVVSFADYHTPDTRFFGFSGGHDPDCVAHDLLETSARRGWGTSLRLITAATARRLSEAFLVEHDRANDDYCYRPADVVALAGSQHRMSRKSRHAFRRLHGYHSGATTCDASDADWKSLIELAEAWASQHHDPHAAADEVKALVRCQEVLSMLDGGNPVLVTTVSVGDAVVAFDITELMDGNWALNHFRHTDLTVRGAYVELRSQVATQLVDRGVACWNAEQDLGVAGLRVRKLRDRPAKMVEKFAVASRP